MSWLRRGASSRVPTSTASSDTASDTNSPTAVVRTLKELAAQHDYPTAIIQARAALARYPNDARVLTAVRAVAVKTGEMTLAAQVAAQQADLPGADLKVAARAHEWQSRVTETTPGWRPAVDPDLINSPVPNRVLHYLKISMPHRQSGYSVRTQYTLRGQADAGLDPVGATALDFPRSLGITDFQQVEHVGGVRYYRLDRPAPPVDEAGDDYLAASAQELIRVAVAEQPSVIHVHSGHRGYDTALVALAVGQATGIPVAYEVRGFFESLWTSDLAWAEQSETYRRRTAIETDCMNAAGAVVTLSESMRADILERGVAPEKVHVVPNCVDASAFAPRSRRVELAQRLGLNGFVFGYVSNIDHYREGHELLIHAAVILRERGIAATALIVGDGSRRAELQALTDELDAGEVVVFTGRVPHEEVLDYYALYDVFVVPRVDERAARLVTPLKPFEAMAAGIPVVVSDLPALTEIIGDGARGATFAVGNATDLAHTLAGLHADPQRRAELAARALEWVRTERSWASNAERYRRIYSQITGSASAE